MVSVRINKKKNNDIMTPFRVITFFAGLLFLILGVRFLAVGDAPGALLNGVAGMLFLLASYFSFRNKKLMKKGD